MAKGILVVESRPADPDREHEYNEWYSGMHLKDVCAVPGFVGARRYKVPGSDPASYIAIYEIEADDLAAPLDELRADRRADGHERRAPDGPAADRHALRAHRVRVSCAQSSNCGASSGQRANRPSPAARASWRSIHSRSPHGGSTRRASGRASARRSDVARVW
jgi:hypothetical protein